MITAGPSVRRPIPGSEVQAFEPWHASEEQEPAFVLGPNERAVLLREERDRYLIRSADGAVGWVARGAVRVVRAGRQFNFDPSEVLADPDDPTPVYILDADKLYGEGISLDRSFGGELRENMDKHTTERIAETGAPGNERLF